MKKSDLRYSFLLSMLCFTAVVYAQPITLTEALDIAVKNNYGIQLVHQQQEMSDLQNAPGYAGMLPQVDADLTYNTGLTNTEQKYFSGDTRMVDNAGNNALNAGVNLNWTIFDGFAMYAEKNKLQELEAMGALQVQAKVEETAVQVMQSWYTMIQLQEALQVAQDQMVFSAQRLRVVQGKNVIGSASGVDVIQAEVDFGADSAYFVNTQLLLQNEQARFNALLGRDPQTAFEQADTGIPIVDLDMQSILTAAESKNTYLQIAQKNEVITALEIKKYKGGLYPQLDLFGAYTYLRSTSEAGFVESNLSYGPSVGVTLHIPLFDGFTVQRDIRQMELANTMQQTATAQTALDIRTAVITLFNTYANARMLIGIEEKNANAAEKNSAIALEKYKLGAITAIELRDIQLQEVSARNRLLSAQLSAKLAEIELVYVSGALL